MTPEMQKRMEELADLGFDERELLELSLKNNGHDGAADFRIGFRYGYRRAIKAGFTARDKIAEEEKKESDQFHETKNRQISGLRKELKNLEQQLAEAKLREEKLAEALESAQGYLMEWRPTDASMVITEALIAHRKGSVK